MVIPLNWGGEGYATYECYLKVSGGEKTAAKAQAGLTSSLSSMMKTQFAEQQGLLNNFLIPQLESMVTNPTGFGATAIAAMKSQSISNIGRQFAAQTQQAQQRFATENMAGLQSGVQEALKGQLGLSAAGMESSALANIDIADAQAKMQQQEFGLTGLAGATSLLGQAPQAAGLAVGSAADQFKEQYTMAQQGGFWSNLATGVLGTVASGLTGGLSSTIGGAVSGLFGGGRPTIGGTPASVLGGDIASM